MREFVDEESEEFDLPEETNEETDELDEDAAMVQSQFEPDVEERIVVSCNESLAFISIQLGGVEQRVVSIRRPAGTSASDFNNDFRPGEMMPANYLLDEDSEEAEDHNEESRNGRARNSMCPHFGLKEFTFSDGSVIRRCDSCTTFDAARQKVLKADTEPTSAALAAMATPVSGIAA